MHTGYLHGAATRLAADLVPPELGAVVQHLLCNSVHIFLRPCDETLEQADVRLQLPQGQNCTEVGKEKLSMACAKEYYGRLAIPGAFGGRETGDKGGK